MGSLDDDEHGKPAEQSDLDPSHLYALAVRIQALAGQIELQREEGRRRDDKIDGVRLATTEVRAELELVEASVQRLVAAQMTEEDKATLRALMRSYTFNGNARKIAFRYAGYTSGVALTAYTLREPLMKFFSALGKAFGL